MFAETGLLFPNMQNSSQEIQQLEDYYYNHQKPHYLMSNLTPSSTILDYDLGEGDLFKAPEPIIEEPMLGLDPMTAAISMVSCGEEVITPQGLKAWESIRNEQLLSEVFYECKKDLMEKAAIETPLSEFLDIQIPSVVTTEGSIQESKPLPESVIAKSVSSGCLSSMDWMHGAAVKPSFLEIPAMDFETVYGMRRAYSEGDIKTLNSGNGSTSLVHSPRDRPLIIGCSAEDRKEKLSRYRNKKSKRNFGRKIKYACRKALADNQPRIRGRFAKTESTDFSRGNMT